ncbi:MAG: hypothetical protein AAGM21_01715 [Pseudomonadota bacterium]
MNVAGRLGAVLAAMTLSVPALAQTPPAPDGPRFVGVDERTHRFDKAFTPTGCRSISESLAICLEGSGYTLEGSISVGRNRAELYRLTEAHDAAIKSVFFPLREALDLTKGELDALAETHLFVEAARGPRRRDRVLFERRRPSGLLYQGAAEVTYPDDSRALVLYTIFTQQWGVGIIETSSAMADVGIPSVVPLGPAEERHAAFLDITRTKTNVGPGY